MNLRSGALAATLLSIAVALPASAGKQESPAAPPAQPRAAQASPAQAPGANPGRKVGGFVPGQKRPPGDPVQIARGKTLFEINCRGCHGADLRGGDLGGPNLLRSQVALRDQDGELIVPVIQGSRQNMGMPAIGISEEDAKAVAAYVRSVVATIGVQGTPPSAGREAPSILVGNASEGKSYFAARCSSCHSATGDLQGIASKIADPKTLQTAWVAGGERGDFSEAPTPSPTPRSVMATVTPDRETAVEGQLIHVDDFLISLQLPDGTTRSFRRDGGSPRVEIRDPLKGHKELMTEYTDKDIHDVTAYLVTLK